MPQLVMLSRPQDFAALQSEGTTRSHPLLVARFRRTDLEATRFGLSTGRRLGGAVVRNRVRRRIREALRVMAPSGKIGFVPDDALSPLGNDQICYGKDGGGWKIVGFIGGDQ